MLKKTLDLHLTITGVPRLSKADSTQCEKYTHVWPLQTKPTQVVFLIQYAAAASLVTILAVFMSVISEHSWLLTFLKDGKPGKNRKIAVDIC